MQSNQTAANYSSIYKSYINTISEDMLLKPEGVERFLGIKKRQGYKASSLIFTYFVLKKLLDAKGIDTKGIQKPEANEAEVSRPFYTKEDIGKLILCARKIHTIYSKAFAMSTIYGLRRQELANHQPSDIDYAQKLILIRTAKGGRVVKHLIPDAIMPYLTQDNFYSGAIISNLINVVARMAGVKVKGTGWHGIRRSLVSELFRNGLSKDKIITFMRWQTMSMFDIYYIKDPKEDLDVFEKHPFLEYWR